MLYLRRLWVTISDHGSRVVRIGAMQTPYGAEEILKEIDNRRRHTLPASKLSQLSRGED